ncbi:MAG TPA: GNAT family N-acetyltransferase [Caulobacteraceae bacterium]|jgi:predicted acetyltransferase
MAAGEVGVSLAPSAARQTLSNLMQLYMHDFSQFWGGTADGELGEDGRFGEYPYLDAYWRESGRVPLLIRAGGSLAGFALVNDASHSGRPVDRNVAEFFIVRKHRRGGVGAAAARAIFSLYPGQWEAAVARRNEGALAFWRQAVAGHPSVGDLEELDLSDARWNGVILRFRINATNTGKMACAS